MIRLLLLSTLFLGIAGATIRANPPSSATPTPPPGASALSPPPRERTPPPSLWDDSKKFVEDGGSDLGGWLAERRAVLVGASVRNPYFWFSVVSFGLIALLTLTLYFERVSEHRKIWKATAAMTDLWNWALYADAQARQAIRTYNTHIDQCNRLADLEAAGKAPARAVPDADSTRLQEELQSLRREKADLAEQLTGKDATIQGLTARVDEIAKQVAGGVAPPTDSRLQAQLMEKVNVLSSKNQQLEQELKDACRKLARFSEDKVPAC